MVKREGHALALHGPERHRRIDPLLPPIVKRGIPAKRQRPAGVGWHRAHCLRPFDLVGAHEGVVDEDRAVIGHALRRDGAFYGAQRLFGGGVAVHMHVDLQVAGPVAVEEAGNEVVRHLAKTAIVPFFARRVVRIGFRMPGRRDGPVKPQLDSAQPHAIDIALVEVRTFGKQLLCGPGRVCGIFRRCRIGCRQHIADRRILGAEVQVDRQKLLVDGIADDVDIILAQTHAAFLRGCLAIAGPKTAAIQCNVICQLAREAWPLLAHREQRGFLKLARQGSVGIAAIAAALWVGCVLVQPKQPQQRAVGRAVVPRAIHHHDRPVGRYPVQFFRRRMAVLGQRGNTVAEPDDPIVRSHLCGLNRHPVDHLGNRGNAHQIAVDHVLAEVDHVAMAIDEPRQKGMALQIDQLGLGCLKLQGFGL